MDEARPWIAEVERELAEIAAARSAASEQQVGRERRTGTSVVYSIRLDPAEVDALERRADAVGVPPTVYARNLIRIGLSGTASDSGAEARSAALRRVEVALADLRALVP